MLRTRLTALVRDGEPRLAGLLLDSGQRAHTPVLVLPALA